MLPYNTGKYHETPEGVPMLHAVDHSLTETMLISLSPSSQFMYEPEVMESSTCGQSQGSAGPPAFEPNSGENFLVKSENMISPTVEGLTFQDCVDPDELFSPPADGLVFSDCLQLNECSAASTPGAVLFADVNKQALFGSVKGSDFIDYEKLQNVFAMSLEGVSYDGGGQKTGGSFDMLLEDEVGFEDCNRLDPLITSTSSVLDGCMKVEGMGNDWFELNKDLYEMPEDAGGLLRDPVFSGGPTLTQLNSKDLDSAGLLGDYNLEDLYGDALTSDERQGVAPPSGSVDLAAVISKFPVGVSGAVASPKFTTCTVTSFVTSLSTSGAVLPQQYPAYVANEQPTGQEPCYSDYGVTELRQKLLTQSQWASIFGVKSGVASIQVNPCCVPVLRRGLQVSDVIGAVVVSGDGSVSLAVTEDPAEALRNLEKHDSANFILDESWKEIERLLLSQSSGTQPADQNISGTTASGPLTIKTEPHDIRIVSPEEMTDKESVFDDSDVENADDANNISDEDVFVGKSDDLGDLNSSGHKDKKYFWQYNTQSKGPKGKRLCKSVETEDPHVLHDFEDPVFDPDQNQTRYKHNGKARRGDGNDVTPNPHKLFVTGNELKKLNKLINDIVPSSEMPASARAKLLKEKNKYASRACRLKKKAQHEANKLKLHGLEHEHRQLMKILVSIKKDIVNHVCNRKDSTAESLADKLETLINENLTLNVAGRTADYVNSVLQKVAKGDRTGSIALDE